MARKKLSQRKVDALLQAAKRWRRQHDLRKDYYSQHPDAFGLHQVDLDLMRIVDDVYPPPASKK